MTNNNVNIVSIRLLSGGHSFSKRDIDAVAPSNHVAIMLCTHKTTLVPEAMLNSEDMASHLCAVGLAPNADECVVRAEAVDGVVAVMAMATSCYNYITHRLNTEPIYCTPLLIPSSPTEGALLSLCGDTLYVSVYRSGLRFAQAMPIKSDADILYYLESVHRVYDIYNMYARAKGDTTRLMSLCKHLFKNIVCE